MEKVFILIVEKLVYMFFQMEHMEVKGFQIMSFKKKKKELKKLYIQ